MTDARSSTIHANDYSATAQTVAAAIGRSISHTEIATIVIAGSGHREAIEAELAECCEGTVVTGDEHGTVEFWGVSSDDDGEDEQWRVHVVD